MQTLAESQVTAALRAAEDPTASADERAEMEMQPQHSACNGIAGATTR
jgi:hypothetical protein